MTTATQRRKRTERWAPWVLLAATIVLWQIICSACRSRKMHHSSSRVRASSAPKGSSSSSILGSWMRARQMLARCCMPPESCHGNFFSMPPKPTLSSKALARASYSLRLALKLLR